MIIGVIYKYTSPSGKSYIGQTTDEAHRRSTWFCTRHPYAGDAINKARAKYGPENFDYEVLHKKYYFNLAEATADLDKWECYYIGYYDTYYKGYNLTFGGDLTNRGSTRTDEWREKQRKARLGSVTSEETKKKLSHALKGKKHSEERRASNKNKRRTSGRHAKIGQYSSDYNLVKVWNNGMEASEFLNINSANIYRATRTFGMYMDFYWRKYDGQQVCSPKPKKKIIKPKAWKKVVQMDMDGNVLNVYDNIRKACDAVGANNKSLMSRCLNQKVDKAYGYKWKFYNCA